MAEFIFRQCPKDDVAQLSIGAEAQMIQGILYSGYSPPLALRSGTGRLGCRRRITA
jgi:hypothetical protein